MRSGQTGNRNPAGTPERNAQRQAEGSRCVFNAKQYNLSLAKMSDPKPLLKRTQ